MRAFLSNILPRIQEFSQTLDKKELLVDQPWVLLDEKSNKQQYIFERNGSLIMSLNGIVKYGKWRYISPAKSLVIDQDGAHSLLLNHAFVSVGALILKKDGFKDEPWILVNQRIVPDLDLERYLFSLLPENKHLKELKLDRITLFYSTQDSRFYGSVEAGMRLYDSNGNSNINGVFKSETGLYYEIKDGYIKRVYAYVVVMSENIELIVETNSGRTIEVNNNVYSNRNLDPVPNGKYNVTLRDVNSIIIKDGKIVSLKDNHPSIVIFFLFVILLICVIIALINS